MEELLAALQETAVAEALRLWRWAYPLANAAHLLGVALLFGAILPLDLRLIGFWPSVAVKALARVLVPVAGAGLALAVATGPLLFSVDALRYAGLPLFQLKLLLIAAAVANVVMVHRSRAWKAAAGEAAAAGAIPSPRLRLAGLVSAALWLLVMLCGRFIAYT